MTVVKTPTRRPIKRPTAPDLHPHCVFCAPFTSNLRDYVSGAYIDLVRDGELTYLRKNGTYGTAPADHPAIGKYGVFHDGAGTNKCDYSTPGKGVWDVRSDGQFSINIVNSGQEFKESAELRGLESSGTNDTFIFYGGFTASVRIEPSFLCKAISSTGTLHCRQTNGGAFGLWDIDLSKVSQNKFDWITKDHPAVTIDTEFTSDSDGNGGIQFYSTTTGGVDIDIKLCQQEESTFSSSPIYTNGSSASRATQAADSSGNGLSVPFSKLDPRVQAALGGEGAPLGSDIKRDLSTDWTPSDGWSYDSATGYFAHTTTGTYDNLDSSEILNIGKTYEIKIEIISGSGDIQVQFGAGYAHFSGSVSAGDIIQVKGLPDPDATSSEYVRIQSGDPAFQGELKIHYVRPVQPEGTLITRFSAPIDYQGGTTEGVISVNDTGSSILMSAGNYFFQVYDSLDSYKCRVAIAVEANTLYDIYITWSGDNVELGFKRVNENSWTKNSGSFTGSFSIQDYLYLFFDNEYPQWIKNLKIYDKALSDAEIEREAKR